MDSGKQSTCSAAVYVWCRLPSQLPINHLLRTLVSWSGLSQGLLHALSCGHLKLNVNRRTSKFCSLSTCTLHTACAEENIRVVLPCRVHALFHTDKICCEPLTEWLHFANLRDGQPDYMVYLVRTIQALGVLVDSVYMELAAAHQPLQLGAARNKQLTDSIPYMLRNDRLVLHCPRPQFGYNLAPRLMWQARWPHEVPAHMLVPVAFFTLYARCCCKWFCYTWIPYKYCVGNPSSA